MNERWNWLARYAVVIVVALALAAALGATDLFNKTRLITKGLSASHLVRCLGYGAALSLVLAAIVLAFTIVQVMLTQRSRS